VIAHGEREPNPFLVLYDVKQVQAAELAQRRTAVSSKCFKLYYTCSDRLLAVVLPPCSFHFFPSYCDVSQARSYFASTISSGISATLYVMVKLNFLHIRCNAYTAVTLPSESHIRYHDTVSGHLHGGCEKLYTTSCVQKTDLLICFLTLWN
jgi:hypothetical protein